MRSLLNKIPKSPDSVLEHDSGPRGIEAAPLLQFLRAALASSHGQPLETLQPSSPSSIHIPSTTCLREAVRAAVPRGKTLEDILVHTRPFWSIWPLAGSRYPATIAEAREFVNRHLHQDTATPGETAKGLVWLSLCIQQLPKSFTAHCGSPRELVNLFFDEVDSLLRKSPESVQGVEAMVAQWKCFVNAGRPRRAWKCSRAALDSALLLGMHQARHDEPNYKLWMALCAQDVQMACFLGLPYSVPDRFMLLGERGSPDSGEMTSMGRLNELNRHIIERNQTATARRPPPYSVTMRLAEEMDEIAQMLGHDPASSLNSTVANDTSEPEQLGGLFWHGATVFFSHFTNTLIHLPHLLAAKTDSRLAYSGQTALLAAEAMIIAFQSLPSSSNGIPAVCDFLDYAVLTGALIIVTDLISGYVSEETEVSHTSFRGEDEESRLWQVVMGFARSMRIKAALVDSSVAAQAAEVVENLHAARYGNYNGPEDHEVMIPYFGRVCFRIKPAQSRTIEHQLPAQIATSIGLNTSAFGFGAAWGNFGGAGLEMGEDWTALDCAGPWDWNPVFNFDPMVLEGM